MSGARAVEHGCGTAPVLSPLKEAGFAQVFEVYWVLGRLGWLCRTILSFTTVDKEAGMEFYRWLIGIFAQGGGGAGDNAQGGGGVGSED